LVWEGKLAPATEGGSIWDPLISPTILKVEKAGGLAGGLDCQVAFFSFSAVRFCGALDYILAARLEGCAFCIGCPQAQ
jgi:hypothetical protein